MSLIEKAVNKQGADKDKPAEPVVQEVQQETVQTTNVVEQAVAKQTQPSPAPVDQKKLEPSQNTTNEASINIGRLKAGGFVTPEAERTEIAEEFRLIKRPLLANAFGQGADAIERGNMIMVTSSMPGEGKTFCTINLALSIAMEMDRTVLLVDADVAKPKLLQYLGLRAEKGLLDVLRGHESLPNALLKTNIEKLTILPAGKSNKHATELLASDAMNSLIEDLASRYSDRIVIFDSPPLLATSESSVLATHMGQIVMVVEADKTPQAAVREALGQIEDSGALISMMLNKTTPMRISGYYGYGYGYGKYGN